MPLTSLIRNLNDLNARPAHWAQGIAQFVSTQGRVFIRFADLLLESTFQPIIETATGKAHGHAAALQAYSLSTCLPIDPEQVFLLPGDNEEFVYLDRLVRTLHTLNYLIQPAHGNLLLKVHPLHVASVPDDHGLAFEGILRSCGLLPRQITLQLQIDPVADNKHLQLAVRNYRSRGFGIALKTADASPDNLERIEALRADFVKLDARLLASVRTLHHLTDPVHQSGAQILIEGTDAVGLRSGAAQQGIDLLQLHAASVPHSQKNLRLARPRPWSLRP